jgi:hypothetical protein
MTNHTELINLIAEKIGAKTYLEIGVFDPEHNFEHINVEKKLSIDPDPNARAIFKGTSDSFFFMHSAFSGEPWFDLIFIDGLHHADQVKRDIENSWNSLNVGGVIVIHDCNPPSEATTCVPRGKQREWCGDVYKAVCDIGLPFFTVDFDYGCAIIRKGEEKPFQWEGIEVNWEVFEKNRKGLLSLISPERAIEIITSGNFPNIYQSE